MLERIPCVICPNEIVIHSGESHDGICRFCRKLSPVERDQKRRFYLSVDSGETYRLSKDDLARCQTPPEWSSFHDWTIQENWLSKDIDAMGPLLADAADSEEGYVMCKSDRSATFLIASNEKYAVCLYQSDTESLRYFAYTKKNLRTQVERENHLYSACPCCGILQGGYFPSRFHLSKRVGYRIANRILMGANCDVEVKWIPADNTRWIDAGIG